jgi:DNA-binding NtrC family response regulator
VISYVLGKTGWNRTKASKILDISYRALLTKIKDLKIKQEADFFNLVS